MTKKTRINTDIYKRVFMYETDSTIEVKKRKKDGYSITETFEYGDSEAAFKRFDKWAEEVSAEETAHEEATHVIFTNSPTVPRFKIPKTQAREEFKIYETSKHPAGIAPFAHYYKECKNDYNIDMYQYIETKNN